MHSSFTIFPFLRRCRFELVPLRATRKGFTLIELLATIGIISVLVGLTIPALQSITRAGGVTNAAAMLSDVLQAGRASAMAGSTFVYVGIRSEDGAMSAILMASPTAQRGNTSNLNVIGRPLRLEGITLNDALQLPGVPEGDGIYTLEDSDFTALNYQSGAGPVTFSKVIRFAPDGSATLIQNSPARGIAIGLDAYPPTEQPADSAVVYLNGVNGSVEVFRL